MQKEVAVLLVGNQALALAPRLQATGYLTLDWSAGAAAMAPAPESPPLLAVVAMDQVGLIPQLRSQFGRMPILLDVEHDTVEGREACLSAGANDFWLSSLGVSDLLQRLRLHCSIHQNSQHQAAQLRVADLCVDPSCRQVRRGNRPVVLTAREYALLMLLFSCVGRVVSREQILAEVWNDDQGTSSNVIEVYVRYLRQKLEEDGEQRLIHTIRGRGYSLSDGLPRGLS
jgi:DNA-binding response OmpR family regulator